MIVVVPPNAAARVPVSNVSLANVPPKGSSMCVWTSIAPGMTSLPVASITRSTIPAATSDPASPPTNSRDLLAIDQHVSLSRAVGVHHCSTRDQDAHRPLLRPFDGLESNLDGGTILDAVVALVLERQRITLADEPVAQDAVGLHLARLSEVGHDRLWATVRPAAVRRSQDSIAAHQLDLAERGAEDHPERRLMDAPVRSVSRAAALGVAHAEEQLSVRAL